MTRNYAKIAAKLKTEKQKLDEALRTSDFEKVISITKNMQSLMPQLAAWVGLVSDTSTSAHP